MKLWPFESKNLPTRSSGTVLIGGGSGWTRSENYITDGYQLNAVVYRCVREIVDGCANISIELHQGDTILESHPVLDLLSVPNPVQGYDDFIKNIFTDYMTTGEMFVYGSSEERPVEIWPLNPTEIEVKPGRGRIPKAYVHKVNGQDTIIQVDPMTARSQLFMMKMYNPSNHWRGQSPLMAAGLAGDTHNAGSKWNYKLLKNSARPSGIIKFKDGDPDTNTINRLKEFFKRQIQGEENAGEIPMLTGGAEWQGVDTNPKDMDFLNTMQEMSKLIALAYGIPLPLISNDASTFNNMSNARERLYTDTTIPLFNAFLDSFGNWILPAYGDNLKFKINMDDIPALEDARARKYDRAIKAKQAGILTVDETRVEIGYEPLGGAAAELDLLGGISLDVEGEKTDAVPDLSVTADVQATALNGAQITSLQAIVQSVADGLLPAESAIEVILAAFPNLTREDAERIVVPARTFTQREDTESRGFDLAALAYGNKAAD